MLQFPGFKYLLAQEEGDNDFESCVNEILHLHQSKQVMRYCYL